VPGNPTGTATAAGNSAGATVSGLINGHSYTITVTATNAAGTGPAATAIPNPLTLPVPTGADIATTVTAPATVNQGPTGVNITYSITVKNNGPADAAQVLLNATPSLSAGFASTTAPACVDSVGGVSLQCNLGSIASGGSTTVTVTVLVAPGVTGNLTGTFSASAFDASSVAIPDAVPGNNSASAVTNVAAAGGGGGGGVTAAIP